MRRTFEGLVPADDEALDALAKLKVGEVVKADIVKPRNVGFHRKFHAMCRTVFDNQDQYETYNVFLNVVVKVITGHVETVIKTVEVESELLLNWGQEKPLIDPKEPVEWRGVPNENGGTDWFLVKKTKIAKTYVGYIPKSISFAAMDQHEFENFYYDTLTALCNRYFKDSPETQDQIERHVNTLVGFA